MKKLKIGTNQVQKSLGALSFDEQSRLSHFATPRFIKERIKRVENK